MIDKKTEMTERQIIMMLKTAKRDISGLMKNMTDEEKVLNYRILKILGEI